MNTFTASRLSEGNKVFPCRVEIDDHGVTVAIPGLFKGKSEHIPFDQISRVSVETPIMGYSKIIFDTTGWGRVKAHGFGKAEVNEMKELIQQGKRKSPGTSVGGESEAVQLKKLEIERERELEQKAANKAFYAGVAKYWKVWVPILAVIIGAMVYQSYAANARLKEAAKTNLELEKLNDEIVIMMNDNEPRDMVLEAVNRLVHPAHEAYPDKSKGFKTVYYDEYWKGVREKYKQKLLNDNKKNTVKSRLAKPVEPIVKEPMEVPDEDDLMEDDSLEME